MQPLGRPNRVNVPTGLRGVRRRRSERVASRRKSHTPQLATVKKTPDRAREQWWELWNSVIKDDLGVRFLRGRTRRVKGTLTDFTISAQRMAMRARLIDLRRKT